MIEVARAAGVSPSTVSRILNGSARVAPAKREAVERAVADLGFRPNFMAQHLARGTSRSVGVITQDIASPFYNDALSGIEYQLMREGYTPLIVSGHWHTGDTSTGSGTPEAMDAEGQALELLLARRVEALIVLGGSLPEDQLRLAAQHVPVVVLGRRFQAPDLGRLSIALDNFSGAYLATAHLLERGHRCIGHLMGIADHPDAQERLHGYQQALVGHGLNPEPALVQVGDFHEVSGQLAMARLLEQNRPLTAVFCSNDQMAYGARLTLYRRGLRVPEDVSLVGFDDQPHSAYTTPPLTSVRQPMRLLGKMAAEGVLARLAGGPARLSAPPLELIVRESTAYLRR